MFEHVKLLSIIIAKATMIEWETLEILKKINYMSQIWLSNVLFSNSETAGLLSRH